MTGEPYDWAAALSNDVGHAFAHAAETALEEATEAAAAGANRDPQTLALIGVGYAVLASRATAVRTGEDVAAELNGIREDIRDLAGFVMAPRRHWWQRLAARVAGSDPAAPAVAEAAGDEHQGDEHEGQEDGTPIPPRPAGGRLHVVGKEGRS